MKRKVLYVITKANWGGAQRYVFDLATNLPKEEFEPMVAYGQSGILVEKLEAEGIATYQVPSMARDIVAGADLKSFFELLALYKKIRPEVVHLNSSKAGGVGALAARIVGIQKIIFTAHGWPFNEDRSPLARAVIWFLSWLTALLSHTVIAVSDADFRLAQKMPFVSHKTIQIYNGIGPTELASGEKIRNAFPTGVHITGTIGELTKNKNQQALIEKARINQNFYVAIVGEGEERGSLEKLIEESKLQDRVKLFGFLPAKEVLRGFDTFALPSIKEGLPYVLLEAKQAGLPIEANRVGGVGEIIDAKDMSNFELARMIKKTLELYR
jgi:glycosyltransferase involved in cell wall biosynthesis